MNGSEELKGPHNGTAQHRLLAKGITAALLISTASALCSLFLTFPPAPPGANNPWTSPGNGLLLILCVPAGRALANAILYFNARQPALAASALATVLLLIGGVTLCLLQ